MEFLTDKQCLWEAAAMASDDGYAITNGVVIDELSGMTYLKPAAKGLAIVSGYVDWLTRDGNNFGPFHGDQFLWLCAKNANYFVIPHVAVGTTVKMGIETHKYTSARGVTLFIGQDNSGTALADPVDGDGNAVAGGNVEQYTELTWTVPADAEATNDDGTVDLCVRCNSGGGMHIYFIQVGDGDAPQTEEAKKVAYLGTNEDFALGMFDDGIVAATVVDAVPAIETLQENYDALVIGTGATGAQLAAVKDIIAFFPVVNTNPALYAALGMGSAADAASSTLTVTATNNGIFEGLDETIETAGISALTLGDYFAKDDVLAKAGDAVAMHVHNAGRNAYYFVPVDENTEQLYTLLSNAIVAASKTKKAVAAVGKPSVTFKQEDGKSIVTITAANAQTIYYTTDGSTPDLQSPVYTGPFELTQETFVRAIAIGDGFTMSDGVSVQVTIAQKAATPTIAVAREAGKSTVTLSTTTAGVDIYYNFAGQSATTASVKYSEPFEVTTPATLTVFAGAADGILASETAQQFIGVDGIDNKNIRWDVIGHFDANEEWKGKGQQTDDNGNIINANYFFTWGKNAGKYWDETSEQVQKVDDEGNPATDDDGNPVMTYTKALEASTFEAGGWILKSIGQVMTWESLNIGWNIGDTSMRNPDTAEDAIGVNDEQGITANALTFGKQPSDGPFNASLETTGKYQGPFDVVVYAGNGNEGEIPTMQIETSTDGETWTKLGDVAFSLIKRNWKKTQMSFEGTDEVYVRLLHTKAKSGAQIYDIYILNNGEKSKAYSEEATGISNVKNVFAGKTAIYNLNGVRQQSLKRGLNIVIENGKAKKVMKD